MFHCHCRTYVTSYNRRTVEYAREINCLCIRSIGRFSRSSYFSLCSRETVQDRKKGHVKAEVPFPLCLHVLSFGSILDRCIQLWRIIDMNNLMFL